MQISLTTLKANAGKYIDLADTTDVFITRNGKPVAKLIPVKQDKASSLKAILGAIPNNMDYDKIREERLCE